MPEPPNKESAEHKGKRKKRSSPDANDLSWHQHRRIVEDLSDSLARNWKFKLQVCGIVIVVSATVISLVTLVIGGRIIDSQIAIAESGLTNRITNLSNSVETKLKNVDAQVDEVRGHVEARINKEFEQAQIKSTLARFRNELDVLKKRNELTRLTDQAIGERSLPAYQKLSKMLDSEIDEKRAKRRNG